MGQFSPKSTSCPLNQKLRKTSQLPYNYIASDSLTHSPLLFPSRPHITCIPTSQTVKWSFCRPTCPRHSLSLLLQLRVPLNGSLLQFLLLCLESLVVFICEYLHPGRPVGSRCTLQRATLISWMEPSLWTWEETETNCMNSCQVNLLSPLQA